MRRNLFIETPSTLVILAQKFDGIKLPEPRGAAEYQEGPLSFVTCGFPGLLDSSLRVLLFRPIEGLEFVCHARISFRPCSASADLMSFELDFEALRDLLRGTGIRTIDTAEKRTFAQFYHNNDETFMSAFRGSEGDIRLTENVAVLRAA